MQHEPTPRTRRIGLMGGTFDPIHFGHLFIAEEARVRCGLEEVVFFPNRKPAHLVEKIARADAETRYQMTRLAVEGNAHFRLSRVELEREGPSYAIDTVDFFQRKYGAQTELFFIAGADSMEDLPTWHRAEELMQRCRFIGVSRPGYSLGEAARVLSETQRERIMWLEAPGLHISSTDLRARVERGQTIRYLVPREVEQFIVERKLYTKEAGSVSL